MAQTPEGRVKDQIKKRLKAADVWYFMPVSNGMGTMGVPDFNGVLKGRYLGVEAKAGSNKPTALQLRALKAIDDGGGLALVINESNLDVLDAALKDPITAKSNYKDFE